MCKNDKFDGPSCVKITVGGVFMIKNLSKDDMYQAICYNNKAYDGSFFYAVKTTKIFCKPSCKSKQPLKQNVEYFETAHEAIKQGYRPCKRCRSDLEMFEPNEEVAKQIKEQIDSSFDSEQPLNQILGVGQKRQVELFKSVYNQTPTEYKNSLRLTKAKRLLIETSKSVTEVAFLAHFNSISAFNVFFKKHTGKTPTTFRKENNNEKSNI